ncbi:MAG TPA: SemiSWEET family transporter [Vicinamibacterales bacterium]|jgi:uncharacterized protein with PQ loop repeat
MTANSIAVLIALSALVCAGCGDLAPHDVSSLFVPTLRRSEIIGFLAGFGTTFAAVPDLVAMFRRRSTLGMNPRMAAIMGVFQILWIYYGLLIASRPIIAWNLIAVVINLSAVLAYRHFLRRESSQERL